MARRATSLGPKPSLFFWFVLFSFCVFFDFAFRKKVCLPPEKRVLLLILQCLPLFLPSLFRFPFSLSSLSLSFSIVLSLPSSFLVSVFIPFLFFFVGLFHYFCFMQRTTSTYYILKVVLSILSVILVSCSVMSFQSPFVISTFSLS